MKARIVAGLLILIIVGAAVFLAVSAPTDKDKAKAATEAIKTAQTSVLTQYAGFVANGNGDETWYWTKDQLLLYVKAIESEQLRVKSYKTQQDIKQAKAMTLYLNSDPAKNRYVLQARGDNDVVCAQTMVFSKGGYSQSKVFCGQDK